MTSRRTPCVVLSRGLLFASLAVLSVASAGCYDSAAPEGAGGGTGGGAGHGAMGGTGGGDAGGGGAAGAGSLLTCGLGTVVRNSQCVVAPPATLVKARLTTLKLKYSVSKPAYINNAIPLRFGITASSADNTKPVSTKVNVTFSFVESAPVDPANPKLCDSSGIDVNLVGDGTEQYFDAEIFPVDDCAPLVGAGAAVNLSVDFDKGLRLSGMPTGIDYPPVSFTAAAAGLPDNLLCHTSSDPANPGTGCVYSITILPTPLDATGKPQVDVQLDSVVPVSSVAVVWPAQQDPDVPAGMKESGQPSLVVNLTLALEGRDPYKHKVDASKVPPELIADDPTIVQDLKFGMTDAEVDAIDDLPGAAAVKYDIAPTNLLAANAWKALGIDDPKNPNPDGHVTEIDLTEIEPGAENALSHELYIEGDALTAVSTGGIWATQDDFTVRACIIPSFPEGGNDGDDAEVDSAAPSAADSAADNCKTFPVKLVKATPPATAATSHSFDMTWSRSIGSADRIQISGSLRSNNTLDLNGARSDSEGTLDLAGHVGSDFKVQLARAYGKASALTTLASSAVDIGIEAFGISIFSYQQSAAEFTYNTPFTVAKSFQFPALSYGFGPVSVGITVGVGGNVGLTPGFVVSAKTGPEASVPALAAATSNGLLTVGVTPNIGLTGNVTGGVNLLVASAAVVATLQVVDIGFPITGNLRWGVTALDGQNVKQITIVGNLSSDLTLNWLNTTVDLIGKIGIGWFSSSTTINVFKYENTAQTTNLLTRQLGDPVVLE